MRFLFFLIILVFTSGCISDNSVKHNSAADVAIIKHYECNDDYDSLLIKYASDFKAANVELDKCLSPQLDSFLMHVDTNCLRKQKEYKTFIAIILAKLSIHHLQCCNQGYDLFSMDDRGAKIIVDEFRRMSGYQNIHLEMLNSGFIFDFIESDKSLKENSTIEYLVKKYNKEADRIDAGHILKQQ